jgi:spore coat protein CotH
MNLDDSQMRDRLGYHLFREMGVHAPRCVHARLVINGEYSGLYALVEQIDGRFSRYNFDDGKGNMYKEIWPLRSNGDPYPESEYIKNLKTNEEDNPTAEMMLAFANDVANAPNNGVKEIIRQWMDIDEIMSYIAVDRTIRVDDGPFHWYCGGGSNCTNHNYYWYEEPTARTMHLIPWDLDNSFENIVYDRNPVTPIADESFNLSQRSAACDKLTAGWTMFEEEYVEKKQELISGPMSAENIDLLLSYWSDQIREATQEADQMHNDALSESSWDAALADMKRNLEFARNK